MSRSEALAFGVADYLSRQKASNADALAAIAKCVAISLATIEANEGKANADQALQGFTALVSRHLTEARKVRGLL